MPLEPFYNEIRRFLATADQEVLVIAGKWGVGKTFAWNHLLAQARDQSRIALDKYAYVSLFGLTGLDDVKGAIFQNSVDRAQAGRAADLSTLDKAVSSATSSWRKGLGLARFIPMTADYSAALEKLGFLWVKKQIVCIDDLERKSGSLDMRDILGLISFLKEQRSCKVVVLLNDEKLEGDDKEFRAQLEKVADTAVRFEPSPEEAAEIGIDKSGRFHENLRAHCIALGIVNIRTIKKIERIARRLEEELGEHDPRVLDQAIHSAALIAFAKFQPDVAPTLDFIRSFNPYEGLFKEGGAAVANAPWRELLRNYKFMHLDELDQVILDGIDRGHFDVHELREAARNREDQLRDADDESAFAAAWDLYHESFNDNAQELMDRLVQAVQDTPNAISPTNLSGTITLLKELGWPGDIKALIKGYTDTRKAPADFWDLPSSTFGGEVRDADVRHAFAEKLKGAAEKRDFSKTLIDIGRQRGWRPEDIRFLADHEADDFYSVFKALSGDDFRHAIAGATIFKGVGGVDEGQKKVTAMAEEALRKIASESALNRRRVMQKGVDVPDSGDGETE